MFGDEWNHKHRRSKHTSLCKNATCSEKKPIETIPHIRGVCPPLWVATEFGASQNLHRHCRLVLSERMGGSWRRTYTVRINLKIEENRTEMPILLLWIDEMEEEWFSTHPMLGNKWRRTFKSMSRRKTFTCSRSLSSQRNIKYSSRRNIGFGLASEARHLSVHFFKNNNLRKNDLKDLCLTVLRDTLNIINMQWSDAVCLINNILTGKQ